jgi:hypothetical protein
MNYSNQFYGGYNPYYQPYSYPYQSPFTQPIQNQPAQTQQGQVQNIPQYDFVGNFVKSYDEVRSINPDQTMVFLDKENDKIYIKRINEKGTPETNVFNLTEVNDNIKTSEEQPKQRVEKENVDEKINKAIETVSREFNDRLIEIEKRIKPVAIINKN